MECLQEDGVWGEGVTGTPLLVLWFIKIRGALTCTLNLSKGCEKFLMQIMGTKKVKGGGKIYWNVWRAGGFFRPQKKSLPRVSSQ